MKLTNREFTSVLKDLRRQHEVAVLERLFTQITSHYNCFEEDPDEFEEPRPLEILDDFDATDEVRVSCYDPTTGKWQGWFLYIPNNGSITESFCDWSTTKKDFDKFMAELLDAVDEYAG